MNLTDKEIIKALECCLQEYGNCDGCPYEKYNCVSATGENVFMRDILDLINRLQDEREALINGQETLQKTIVEQKAEIERLGKENYELHINSLTTDEIKKLLNLGKKLELECFSRITIPDAVTTLSKEAFPRRKVSCLSSKICSLKERFKGVRIWKNI